MFRQLNLLSSSVVTSPLPNISPSDAPQQIALLNNPLLQTLFKSNKLVTSPLTKIGLQSSSQQDLSNQKEVTRDNLLQAARERELIEKQRQIDLLLDRNKEKEKLLIDALRQQGKEYLQTVPTFIPTPTTPSPTTPTTTTTVETTTTPLAVQVDDTFNEFQNDSEEIDADSDVNPEYEVEIVLQMTRELVEAKEKERSNKIKDSEELITEAPEDTQSQTHSTLDAIMNAREAVLRTRDSGSEKISPSVWAAVSVLSDFVQSQDPGLPQPVLEAIIQLTKFLNKEIDNTNKDQKDTVFDFPEQPKVVNTGNIVNKSKVDEVNPGLSEKQIALMQRLLNQKLLRDKQLQKIVENSGHREQLNEGGKKSFEIKHGNFPSRINLMDVKLRGNQFSFSTLPIYK